MRVSCPECGGPLFRGKCSGDVHRPARPRVIGKAEPVAYRPDTELVWQASFTEDNGERLRVARWLAFRSGPAGRLRVFPRPR